MRLHAAALAALLLTAPATLLWPDARAPAPTAPEAGEADGPLDGRQRPPPMTRFDDSFVLNDTSVRVPTLPEWPAEEGCLFVESWGGSTILRGGVTATWTPELVGGAEIMTMRIELPDGVVLERTGPPTLAIVLDGVALSAEIPTRIVLRAADRAPPFVHQQATLRMAWEMMGGPVSATSEGCDPDE